MPWTPATEPVPDIQRCAAGEKVATIVETIAGAWKKDEVDLGMAEQPEEVLIEEHVAADGGIEELRAASAIQQAA